MKRIILYAALTVMLASSYTHAADKGRITFTSQPDGAEMILIPEGPFEFGMDQKTMKGVLKTYKLGWAKIYESELPKRRITLPAYYIDRFEVTNERYAKFVAATKHRQPRFKQFPQLNAPRQPVVGIGWADAQAFCQWSGKRLPREEEWEKAARGTDGRIWPWGNQPDSQAYNGKDVGYFSPVPVGTYPKSDSPYGVADMAGNVWEMTSGEWQSGKKCMRGGSYLNPVGDVRVTVRWAASDEVNGANWLGFRCVTDVTTSPK